MKVETQVLELFRKKLEKQREETVRLLNRVREEARGVSQDCPRDMGELSVTSFSKEFLFQQSSQRRDLLKRIDAALDRIRSGRFGECASCDNQINRRRLEAMPFTAYCRECQENLERAAQAERQSA